MTGLPAWMAYAERCPHYGFSDAAATATVTYSYASTFVSSATGSESAQSSALAVTPPSNTLATPLLTTTRDPSDYSTALLSWPTSGYPAGTRFQVEKSTNGTTYTIVLGGSSRAGRSR